MPQFAANSPVIMLVPANVISSDKSFKDCFDHSDESKNKTFQKLVKTQAMKMTPVKLMAAWLTADTVIDTNIKERTKLKHLKRLKQTLRPTMLNLMFPHLSKSQSE